MKILWLSPFLKADVLWMMKLNNYTQVNYHFSLWHILSIGLLIRTFLCFFNIFAFLLESKSFCPSSFPLTSLLAEWKHKPLLLHKINLDPRFKERGPVLKDKITSKVLSFCGDVCYSFVASGKVKVYTFTASTEYKIHSLSNIPWAFKELRILPFHSWTFAISIQDLMSWFYECNQF